MRRHTFWKVVGDLVFLVAWVPLFILVATFVVVAALWNAFLNIIGWHDETS